MNIKEAKKLAGSILEKANVGSVYYVDDFLSYDGLITITKHIEISSVENLESQSDIDIPAEIIIAKEAGVDCTEQIETWWRALASEKQQSIIEHVGGVPHAESSIKKIFGDKCVLCTPEDWLSKYSKECLDKIKKGGKVLLLFDLKIGDKGTMGGKGRDGLDLAQSFSVNEGVKEKSYCGLFSQQFTEEEEFKFRKDNKEELASWAFPISKHRVPNDGDYSLFIEGLNNILWIGYVDELSNVARTLIDDTSKEITKRFSEILPLEFKQVVINSSIAEGCREVDTLIRLIHILFNRELQSSMATHPGTVEKFNTLSHSISELDSVTNKYITNKYDSATVRSYFQDETFISGKIINTLLTPLQNGDVFCVNGDTYYVLLCQPCNISLRKNGMRGKKKYDIGYFVPLHGYQFISNGETKLRNELEGLLKKDGEERNKAKSDFLQSLHKRITETPNSYNYKLPCVIDGEFMCAAISDYNTISLSLLDYCTFSEEGEVVINGKCSESLHENQKLLYENHNKDFKEKLNIDYLLSNLPEDIQVSKKSVFECWFYSFLSKLGIIPSHIDNQYIFQIKRYGHIQDPLASDLLTQLSHYISRAALPSEFER